MKRSENRFDIAVFPLPNAVLFPGTTLPLQLADDRYNQMLFEIQAREWPLAVSLVTAAEGDELVLNTICGAGQVELFRQFPDGHSEVLVHGNQRVRLLRILQTDPYLIMEAERLDPLDRKPTVEHFENLKRLIKAWVFVNPKIPDELSPVFDEFDNPGELTDFFVFHFLKQALDKQHYLNCTSALKRVEMLSAFLETDLKRLTKRMVSRRKAVVLH
jgi:ATP-dependent Lon protease